MKVALKDLTASTDNPRQVAASKQDDEALLASLKAHGQLYPLLVREDGKKTVVIDGNRRLRMLKEAGIEEAEVSVVASESSILELGAIANMIRADMHPLDEADVITRLVESGDTIEEVAVRFGQSGLWVRQRQALSGLIPDVKAMLRKGTLDLGAAIALTRLSTERQGKWFKEQKRSGWMRDESTIRRLAREEGVAAVRALFDISLYPEEKISRDLFSNDVLLLDRDLFQTMQNKAIADKMAEIAAEGWDSVVLQYNDYNLPAELKGYVKVTGKISAKQRPSMKVRLFVTDHHDGEPRIEVDKGWVSKKQAKKVKPGNAANGTPTEADAEDVAEPTLQDLTQAQMIILQHQLTWHLQQYTLSADKADYALYLIVSMVLHIHPTMESTSLRHSYETSEGRLAGDLVRPWAEYGGETLTYTQWKKRSEKQRGVLIQQAAARMISTVGFDDANAAPQEAFVDLVPAEAFLSRYSLACLGQHADAVEAHGKKHKLDLPERPKKKAELVSWIRDAAKTALAADLAVPQPFDWNAAAIARQAGSQNDDE